MVAYDVRDDRRRRKVADELLNFGERVQYSVFECHLDADRLDTLASRLLDLIDADADRVAYYRLCSRDEVQIIGLGNRGPTQDWDYRIL